MLLNKVSRNLARFPSILPGYTRTMRRVCSQSLVIVMYHGVVSKPLPVFNWCQLELSRFQEQINVLSSEYKVIPLREAIERLCQHRPLPKRAAVITFDDGYRNVQTTALPVLEQYQLPFTIFLITGLIGSREPAWPERLFTHIVATEAQCVYFGGIKWPLLTPRQRTTAHMRICAQLKRMNVEEKDVAVERLLTSLGNGHVSDYGFDLITWEGVHALTRTGLVDFGSHTHTHQILSRCSSVRQKDELRASRDAIQQSGGRADLFAYPNGADGDFTTLTQALLKELGYRCGLTTIRGLNCANSDLYQLRRVGVGADASLHEFELLLLGL